MPQASYGVWGAQRPYCSPRCGISMLSQTTEYALRAMACLAARPDELVPTSTLARATHMPPNYLAKVLQHLAGAGLITGRRGAGGGYRLARPAGAIALLDIINAVGEIGRMGASAKGADGSALCPLHRRADAAAAAVMAVYRGTLADLVDVRSPDQPPCPVCGQQGHRNGAHRAGNVGSAARSGEVPGA